MNRALRTIKLLEDFVHHSDEDTLNLHDDLTQEADSHYEPLSSVEKPAVAKSVKEYSMFAYGGMNHFLRHGHHPEDFSDKSNKESEAHIHNARLVTKNPTSHDFHVYRSTNHIDVNALKPGDVIHDRGFTSTSIDPDKYKDSAKLYTNTPNAHKQGFHSYFRIHITPGTKGHYIGDQSEFPEEREFLLHPGTHFRVGQTHKDEDGGTFTDLHIHHQED